MATIRFYGDLQRFGRSFKLEVTSASEALRALFLQIPGLRAHVEKGHYRLRVAREDVSEEALQTMVTRPLSSGDVVHVVPVIGAAKDSGIFSIIVGAVMIAAAFFTGGASIAAWGTMSTSLAIAGGAMMLTGVATMLTPVPKMDAGSGADNGSGNQYFSSLDNGAAQGSCVPLLYGEIFCGSKVLSQGLRTE